MHVPLAHGILNVYLARSGLCRGLPGKTEIPFSMRDDNGLYYYPDPANRQVRVYVREDGAGVSFRLWHQDHPHVWEQHEWLAYDVIKAAASMYKDRGTGTDPLTLYDVNVARALLREDQRKK